MFVGKALKVTISGYDKEQVKLAADRYCEENDYEYFTKIYRTFRLFLWKWEYRVDLYKPIDFKIQKL